MLNVYLATRLERTLFLRALPTELLSDKLKNRKGWNRTNDLVLRRQCSPFSIRQKFEISAFNQGLRIEKESKIQNLKSKIEIGRVGFEPTIPRLKGECFNRLATDLCGFRILDFGFWIKKRAII